MSCSIIAPHMKKETFPLKDLPIEELVERYLSLPNNVASDHEMLPEDLKHLIERDEEKDGEVRELVQKGALDPETADNEIKKCADTLKEDYPEHKKAIDIIYLFNRGKLWVAHSLFLINMRAQNNEIERAQEKTARLFLRTGLAIGVINPALSSYIFNALYTSGHQRQAEMVGKKSFLGMFIAENEEEVVKLAQKMGEKDPKYYKEGIVRVGRDKLNKSGLN